MPASSTKTAPPLPLLQLFGQVKGRLLRALLARPWEALHLREIARRAAVSPGALHPALNHLVKARILRRVTARREVHFRARLEEPIVAQLVALFNRESQLTQDLRTAIDAHAQEFPYACIFGSYARGESREDSDVDVLVVGRERDLDLRGRLFLLGRTHGREVSLTFIQPEEFEREKAAPQGLLGEIARQPRIELHGRWELAGG